MRPGLHTALIGALLFIFTLLLFNRATEFGFLNYDDPGYVTDNPQVQGGLTWTGLRWAFSAPTDQLNWHPLSWLSHMLDWEIYGKSAAGHHLTSVLWHALNAVLVFLLFQRLIGGLWRSAFAAALFAWHPLRVESVVWIAERKDVMSGCFFLLTLLAYTHYTAVRATDRPAWRPYVWALVSFAAGLMSKPMLVTLPLILLLLDFWPLARGTSPTAWRHLVIEKLPFFFLSAAVAVITVVMQRQAGAFVLDLPAGARMGNAVVSIARYLGKFVWPFDLVVCYPHPGFWPIPVVVGACALIIGLGCLAWQQRRARPWIAMGLGWFLVTLLPVIGLVQVGFQAMADRYTYLPLLGVVLALVWSLPSLQSRLTQTIAALLAIGLVLVCAVRTYSQQVVWRDSVSLFEHAVRVSDRNDVAEDFLASALFAAGRFDEAAVHAGRARELNPRNDRVLVTLAGLSERQGKMDEAMSWYRAALTLRPDNPLVQCQLGLLELSRGRADEARTLLIPALRSAPALRERTRQIGRTALEHGDPAALFFYQVVLVADPTDGEAHAGAGFALLARKDAVGAIVHFRAAVERAPALTNAHVALGFLLIQTGDRAGGIAEWQRALELNPNIPGLRDRLQQAEP